MALNPSTNATMTGRVTAADVNYPYASAKDETAPGAGDGTPYFKARADDLFGLQQALLKLAGITPSGNADTAIASQYLQALVELAQGRAVTYDDSGVADAYVLDAQTSQQAAASLFDGQVFEFIAGNTNTGASTVNPVGLGVKNIVNTGTAGTITAGARIRIRYRTATGDFEVINDATPVFTESFTSAQQAISSAGLVSVAHGLSGAPKLVRAKLVCTTAEAGYVAGDVIEHGFERDSNDDFGVMVFVESGDTTNVKARYGSAGATVFRVLNKTAGTNATITNANWKMILEAWR